MRERILSILLAAVLFVGLLPVGAAADDIPTESTVAVEDVLTASDDAIRILKAEEGFSSRPYWDYAQWTVGYGTKCPDDKLEQYRRDGISEEDAELLLREFVVRFEQELHKFMERTNTTLNQNQFDALLLFSYNCGSSWSYDKNGGLYNAVSGGATGNAVIDAFSRWCNAGGQIKTFLLRRRLSEANMYLNGVYSQTPPDNFGYVLYDACGGVSKPNIQGYDTELTAQIIPTPTYEGYTFDGWYTAKTGGTKVEVLDASVKNGRLYARWGNGDGQTPEVDPVQGVQVTVTGGEVNVRQGPGTNYPVIDVAYKGEQLTITETAEGTGYTWGKFSQGWICLDYTDYTKEPEQPTEPAPTEPEETTPTEPETEPETEPTVPEVPAEPENPPVRTGTVKANGGLNIRSGASTGHPVVGSLADGAKVEILEQKIVGAMVWGKVEQGWVSMQYVILDPEQPEQPEQPEEPEETEPPQTQPTQPQPEEEPELTEGWTGTVVSKDVLRIRSAPSITAEIVGYLSPGEKVTITREKKTDSMTWGKMTQGWISLDYVKADTPAAAPKRTGTVKVEDYLRVRSGPGVSYAIAGYISNGTKVEITEEKTVGGMTWGKLSNGWISLDYVVFEQQTPESTGQTVTGTVKVGDFLRIRSGPGTQYDTVGYLANLSKVEITEQKTVEGMTWGKISNGWISMTYVELEKKPVQTQPQKVVKTVTADCLRLRSGPGTSYEVVGYLYTGAKVEILQTQTAGGTAWGKTAKGWLSMDYVK